MNRRIVIASYTALALAAASFFSGCTTGPVQTNNPNPPSGSFLVTDQETHTHLSVTPAGGSPVTVFIKPGDDYVVTYQAASPSGIKSITMSGSGEVICSNNQPPYDERDPFKYSIPAQTIDLSPLPGQQVFTQAVNPFFFFWNPGPEGEPAFTGPAASAFAKCGTKVPLLGTTTYTGKATTDSGVTSPALQVSVGTCSPGPITNASGTISSPGVTCGS